MSLDKNSSKLLPINFFDAERYQLSLLHRSGTKKRHKHRKVGKIAFATLFATSIEKVAHASMAIRIVCRDGSEVTVPKTFREKMSLFQKPGITEAGSYEVQCQAGLGTLNMLLSRVYNESAHVKITKNNVDELRALVQELGFAGIDQELRAFVADGTQEAGDMKRELLQLRERAMKQDNALTEIQRQLNELASKKRRKEQMAQQFRSLEERVETVKRMCEDQGHSGDGTSG